MNAGEQRPIITQRADVGRNGGEQHVDLMDERTDHHVAFAFR